MLRAQEARIAASSSSIKNMNLSGPLCGVGPSSIERIFLRDAKLGSQFDEGNRKYFEPREKCICIAETLSGIDFRLPPIIPPFRGQPRKQLVAPDDAEIPDDAVICVLRIETFDEQRRFIRKSDAGKAIQDSEGTVDEKRAADFPVEPLIEPLRPEHDARRDGGFCKIEI